MYVRNIIRAFESFILTKDKVKLLMSADNVRKFGDYVEKLYDARRGVLYKYNKSEITQFIHLTQELFHWVHI